jgi:hypothetical protein
MPLIAQPAVNTQNHLLSKNQLLKIIFGIMKVRNIFFIFVGVLVAAQNGTTLATFDNNTIAANVTGNILVVIYQ